MKRLLSAVLIVALGLVGVGAVCTDARAEGFALYDWGARGSGLANGLVGRADDPSAVAHNPAGITQLPGTQVMVGASVITPKMLIDTIDDSGNTTTSRVERHYHMIPHGYFTHQLTDTVWLGVGVFTRFGLGNQYPSGWPGSGNLQDVYLQTLSVNPNVAFKVTDKLSLAFGFETMIARMKMHKMTALPMGNFYQSMKAENGCGIGFNVAAHYKFNEQWAAGVSYRSAITHKVSGDSSFYGLDALNSSLEANLRLPDHIAAGVTYKPRKNLSFEVGAVYTVWSRFRNFNVHFDTPLSMSSYTPKDWKDTWLFNVSVEYLPLDWLALRLGYSYETSPIPAGTADYMVETNGRQRYSCGVGFMLDNWTIDLAYSLLRSRELDYYESSLYHPDILPGKSRHGITHMGSVSVSYKF